MDKQIITFGKQNGVSFQEKLMPSGESKIRTTSKKIIRDKKIFVNYNNSDYEQVITNRLEVIGASIERKKLLKKEKKVKEKKMIEKGVEKKITIKEVDDIFSKYIRLKYGDVCYTCGRKGKCGAGHYISRQVRELRWDERNVRPQEFLHCNAKFSGNGMPTEFRANLKRDGIDTDELDSISLLAKQGKSKRPNSVELREIYDFWKNKYEILKNEEAINLTFFDTIRGLE